MQNLKVSRPLMCAIESHNPIIKILKKAYNSNRLIARKDYFVFLQNCRITYWLYMTFRRLFKAIRSIACRLNVLKWGVGTKWPSRMEAKGAPAPAAYTVMLGDRFDFLLYTPLFIFISRQFLHVHLSLITKMP